MENLFADRVHPETASRLAGLFPVMDYDDAIKFTAGAPAENLFPSDEMKQAYLAAMAAEGDHTFQYHTVEGPYELRERLAKRARERMKITDAKPENVMLTAGGQQGIDLVAKLLLNKGDAMVVEAPTYVGALASFDMYEPTYYEVNLEADGMAIDQLETLLRAHPDIKFLYTVADFHNPGGVTLSLAKRQRLVELANQYDFMILEDTPYRDLRYVGESLPTIKSFDTEGRVIFLSSFSKVLMPALRLGWLVADEKVLKQLYKLKEGADLEVPNLTAAAVNNFLANNSLDDHIAKLNQEYLIRQQAMLKAIATYMPEGVTATKPEGGFFTWVTVPESINTTDLLYNEATPNQHIAYVPSKNFYAYKDHTNGMRLNFTGLTPAQIDDGMKRLGTLLADRLTKVIN
ncbi:aminotransferase-like domain-containing protein [Secundilactobacillus paracollinoides]|uniref:Aspartate aminotransferase n=1 Tax=Secundilactobacillus paracollinoides TaxID=240427 RepID=A0A1B2IVC2_9LACO|nr:PLP-dependent aminotransferase family protein [Secundilactobacillus paracollinoides]ANZ60221.1 aspartate aminotransferase [Secundilactobacillus paracollinoides]ANZ66016.1 aspartate aminotransferase [Secundilactobacillus paracollinoides]